MTTATLPRTLVRESKPAISEFVVPSYALRDVPMPTQMPKDELGRDIVLLLAGNPGIAPQFASVNLDTIGSEAKVELLANIKLALGIKPTNRRRLGYVGS